MLAERRPPVGLNRKKLGRFCIGLAESQPQAGVPLPK
jgi:hypothetical protein